MQDNILSLKTLSNCLNLERELTGDGAGLHGVIQSTSFHGTWIWSRKLCLHNIKMLCDDSGSHHHEERCGGYVGIGRDCHDRDGDHRDEVARNVGLASFFAVAHVDDHPDGVSRKQVFSRLFSRLYGQALVCAPLNVLGSETFFHVNFVSPPPMALDGLAQAFSHLKGHGSESQHVAPFLFVLASGCLID
jgi:hypothetical protein